MESTTIGSMLGEAVGLALRHWATLILVLLALGGAFLINTVLIVRCSLSPACVPTGVFVSIASHLDEIIWSANRVANWFISGFMIFRVLRWRADEQGKKAAPPHQKWRAFGRCVLYLASISASHSFIDALYRFLAPIVYSTGSTGSWIAFAAAGGLVQVSVWAYVDVRFAPYLASLASGGLKEGFFESWRGAKGYRTKAFVVFLILEGAAAVVRFILPEWHLPISITSSAADFERFTGLPQGALIRRLPSYLALMVYVSVTNLLCAGAFLVVYRRIAAERPETKAAIFD
jgi:hypothetical protein